MFASFAYHAQQLLCYEQEMIFIGLHWHGVHVRLEKKIKHALSLKKKEIKTYLTICTPDK
jgi:hypothetical protein